MCQYQIQKEMREWHTHYYECRHKLKRIDDFYFSIKNDKALHIQSVTKIHIQLILKVVFFADILSYKKVIYIYLHQINFFSKSDQFRVRYCNTVYHWISFISKLLYILGTAEQNLNLSFSSCFFEKKCSKNGNGNRDYATSSKR